MLGRGADGLHAHGALHAVRVVDEVRHVELAADARQIEQLRLGFGFGFGFGFGLALGLGLGALTLTLTPTLTLTLAPALSCALNASASRKVTRTVGAPSCRSPRRGLG